MKRRIKYNKDVSDEFLFYGQLFLASLLIATAGFSNQTSYILMIVTAAFAIVGNYYIIYPISKSAVHGLIIFAACITFGFFVFDTYNRIVSGPHSPTALCGLAIAIQFVYYFMEEKTRIFNEERAAIEVQSTKTNL